MTRNFRVVFCVALLLSVVAAARAKSAASNKVVPSATTPQFVDLSPWLRPLPDSVADWTPLDVEVWFNRTLGYPEYVPLVRTHLIDGPTLLAIDVEKGFAPKHYIHKVKIAAHIELLRNRCACPTKAFTDFWLFLGTRYELVARLGSALVYSPRLALAYIFLFDTENYNALMGPVVSTEAALRLISDDGNVVSDVPWYSSVVYLFFATFAPYLLVVYKVLGVWSSNFFVFSLVISFLLVEQLQEYIAFASAWMMIASGKIPFKRVVWSLVRYHNLAPLVINVLAFVLPYAVVHVLVLVFLLHCAISLTSTIIGFVTALRHTSDKKDES